MSERMSAERLKMIESRVNFGDYLGPKRSHVNADVNDLLAEIAALQAALSRAEAVLGYARNWADRVRRAGVISDRDVPLYDAIRALIEKEAVAGG